MATWILHGCAAGPNEAFVGFPRDERHPPTIEPLVFDADFALAVRKRDPLALFSHEGLVPFDGPNAGGRSSLDGTPHTAYLSAGIACRRKRQQPLLALGFDPQVAVVGLGLELPQARGPRAERVRSVVVPNHGPAIDRDVDPRAGQLDDQRNPLLGGDGARRVLDVLPIVAMPAEPHALRCRASAIS